MSDEEINFDSDLMQAVIPLILEVEAFLKKSLPFEEDGYSFLGIEADAIPEEDKLLLEEWKSDFKMNIEELKERLRVNHTQRMNTKC